MASEYGFEMAPDTQGVVFALSGKAKADRSQLFGTWEAQLRKDSGHICVSSKVATTNTPLSEVVEEAHEIALSLPQRRQ